MRGSPCHNRRLITPAEPGEPRSSDLGCARAGELAITLRKREAAQLAKRLRELDVARQTGSHRARLQYPFIDLSRCIGCGTCVAACPEEGVLDLIHGQAAVIHGARCVAHGRCAQACPVGAVRLTLGDLSERRDIPALTEQWESQHVPGLFLAGEVTGYALIRTAITHGTAVVDEVARRVNECRRGTIGGDPRPFDLMIVGAGPAGLAATLQAKVRGLNCVTIDQESLGGTVAKYPRRKLAMTQPVALPLHGTLKQTSYTKEELMDLWHSLVEQYRLPVRGGMQFTSLERDSEGVFTVHTSQGALRSQYVCLCLGRRGTPRKLGVPGEELDKVAYSLTAAVANNVYLDRGYDAGIQAGDEVVLFPPGRPTVNAMVQSTSSVSCRCVVVSGIRVVDVGTRGEVLVPRDRLNPPALVAPAPTDRSRDHPPWERPPENWDQAQPLLAPARGMLPEERDPLIHGRVFGQYLHTWNDTGADNQYSLARIGTSLWYENPFHHGGRMNLDGEFSRRGTFLEFGGDQVSVPGRLDRISYAWGGNDYQSWRVEAGRFVSPYLPEYGILDGVEVTCAVTPRLRVGFSTGFLPEPFPSLITGQEFHAGAFFRWSANEMETLAATVGFQKTWYRGTPERDLLVSSLSYVPGSRFSIQATVWGDFYDQHDDLKSSPFEISQAVIQPLLRISSDRGVGIFVSYLRWPQLLRDDFRPFAPSQIRGDWNLRYGLFGWQDLAERLRLDARVDRWQMQDSQQGLSWDARLTVRNAILGAVPRERWNTDRGPVVSHDTFPSDCRLCHAEGGWHQIRSDFQFDHARETGTPLFGAQVGNFGHTPVQCEICHAEDLKRTKNPNHIAQGWTQDCEKCHRSISSHAAGFNHSRFPRCPSSGGLFRLPQERRLCRLVPRVLVLPRG